MAKLPLSNIRILDLSLVWAGPYSVMMLSDLGAEVIRVESLQHHITNTRGFLPWPKTKEVVAQLGTLGGAYVDKDPGERPWNRHAMYNSLARDRLSMTADMTREEGQAIVQELVKFCDVLIENNTPGLLKRFGMDYETVHKINPSMVYVTMPIFGLKGPYKDYVGFGTNGEAMSGMLSLRGYRDDTVMNAGNSNHMDSVSGIITAYATLMALYERERSGKGRLVEVSQIEHLVHQVGGAIMDAAMNGRNQAPLGNRDPVRAPQGVYPCIGSDRWVALSVGTDEEWAGLCAAIGRPDLAGEASLAGNLARQRRHDELDEAISAWSERYKPREAMEALQKYGVPSAMLSWDEDMSTDPHLQHRGFFHWKEHPEAGRHRYPGHTYKLSGTPLRFDLPPALLGQHNDFVYREMLGYPEAEIQRLKDEKHIGMDYLPDVR